MFIQTFLKHFVISGAIVGVSAILIEHNNHKLSGFLYGGLPIGFLYLLFIAKETRQKAIEFSRETFIGGIFFLFYTFLIYMLFYKTNMSVPLCVSATTISFIAVLFLSKEYLYNMYFKDAKLETLFQN
jgi:hypothetical protein